MKGKVCKKCKVFVEHDKCPICQGTKFTETWKGRIIVMNPEQSELARKLHLDKKGIITITKQEKKSLIGREEIEATTITEPTPSNKQVQEELAKKLNKKPELIIIKHIYSKFGSHENKIIAYIYDNEESLKKFEKIKQTKGEETKKEETKEPKQEEKQEEKSGGDKVKENKE
jgi:DNA-directed RNA polymerase subunit E"